MMLVGNNSQDHGLSVVTYHERRRELVPPGHCTVLNSKTAVNCPLPVCVGVMANLNVPVQQCVAAVTVTGAAGVILGVRLSPSVNGISRNPGEPCSFTNNNFTAMFIGHTCGREPGVFVLPTIGPCDPLIELGEIDLASSQFTNKVPQSRRRSDW